jgi:hypothetical protein
VVACLGGVIVLLLLCVGVVVHHRTSETVGGVGRMEGRRRRVMRWTSRGDGCVIKCID